MKDFQSTMSKIVKDHKKGKRYLAFLVALSMIVSVAVPFSLIMPAISMTYDYEDETFPEENSDNPDSDGLTLLSLFNANTVSKSASSEYSNAVEIRNGNEGCKITSLYINDNNENSLSDLEITGNNLSINFGLSYEFPNLKNKFVSGENSDNRYMYVELKSPGLLLNSESRIGLVKDTDYYFDYLNRYSGLSDEERENIAAGTYEIKDDYILITLTDDYINYLNSGTGQVKGTLSFDGTLSRNNNANNNYTINFAGQEVPVKFQEEDASITKGNGVIDYDDRTIHWTITVNNPGRVDLSQYELMDSMFENAENVTIKDENDNTVGAFSDKKVTFNQNLTATPITIEYDTPIGSYETSISNTAKLEKKDSDYKSTDNGSAWARKPFSVEKSGKPDYKDGTYTGKIKWTITVTGDSAYNTSLDGYVLTDAAFSSAENIKINDVALSDNNGKIEGNTLTLRNVSGTSATITYETVVSESEKENPVTNNVEVKEPKSTHTETAPANVTYRKKSDLIDFTKNGNNYDADKHEITWEITVTPKDGISLDDYALTDSQFPSDVNKFVSITGQSGKDYKNSDFVEVSNGTLTFKNNSNIRENVVIKYTTQVDLTNVTDGASTNVDNDISDNNTHSTRVTKTVTKRNTLTKTKTNASGPNTVTSNKAIEQTIDWTVNITNDGTFAGKTYTDKLSVTEGATHTIKDPIEVWAGTTSNNKTKLTSGYTISKTSDGFTVTFTDALDKAGYNHVEIKYSTTATIPQSADFGKYQFKNTGFGFGDGEKTDQYEIEKDNPEKEEKLELKISKNWQGNDAAVRPSQVKVKLLYNTKTGNKDNSNYDNTEWKQYGNIITLTGNATSESWTTTLSDLLKSKTDANDDGGPKDTVYYFYKIVELDEYEQEITNNYFTVTKNNHTGVYEITNSGETNQNNASQELTITNKYHEEKISLNAHKEWYKDDDYSKNRPSEIIVALQKKDADGNWKTVEEKRLNSDNGWNCSFDNLESYTTADGTVKTYEYRIVEIGYKYGSTVYSIPKEKWENPEFATTDAGYYTGTYASEETADGKTFTITNKFQKYEKIAITPQKTWEINNDSGESIDGKTVTFILQRKTQSDSTWLPVEGYPEITLSESDFSESQENNNNNIITTTTKWKGQEITDLPKQKITNENGIITREDYYYRFVEKVGNQELTNGDSYKTPDGEGRFKIEADENGYSRTSVYEIKNKFEKNIGVEKDVVNQNLNAKKETVTMDKDAFLSSTAFKRTFDGEDYYVFNWVISFDTPGKNSSTYDQLPPGFTLVESEANGMNYFENGSLFDYSSLFDPSMEEKLGAYCSDGYYYRPHSVYSNMEPNTPNLIGVTPLAKETGGKQYVIGQASERYYYDEQENRVYFPKPSVTPGTTYQLCYATKIKCSDLNALLDEDTYEIKNNVIKVNDDGSETEDSDSASFVIVNKASSNLVTKKYKSQGIPGYVGFSLDINPDGKNLSNGDTIDIEDIFKTESYFDKDKNLTEKDNENLVDVLMNNIRLYKVDANGNKTRLDQSEYTLKFESNENGVNSQDNKKGAALLKLTIPDETHIAIDYVYKLIANHNTPSVLNGCKSSDRDSQGKLLVMAPGMVPPAGDIITFSNYAKLYSDSASADDSVENKEYQISKSSGTISTNRLPKVKKVDVGNYGINDLSAKFLLARYDKTTGKWQYASVINREKNEITEWTDFVDNQTVANGAIKIDVNTQYTVSLSLDKDTLYKLIEIEVPKGYEGSNLKDFPVSNETNSASIEALIVKYLNNGTTEYNGTDYANFLEKFISTYYFVYNSVMTSYPDGIKSNQVLQVKSGEDIEIPNNQLIDIDVTKNWHNENNGGNVEVELYWSHTKASSGMPSDAIPADAAKLGIMDPNFNAVQTVTPGSTNPGVWKDLPNGKDGKPIYYYVKEKSYTIGGKVYTLSNDGVYRTENNEPGAYYPTYVGNAANTDSNITITNSQQLMLKKVWKNASGNPLSDVKILANSITVDIYGSVQKDYGLEEEKEPILSGIQLEKDKNWERNITDLLKEIDLSKYTSFRAEETGINTDDYVISCVFNLDHNTGEITVTNKSKKEVDASVTVNKTWSDGAANHKNHKIKVSLYQATTQIDIANMTQTELTAEIHAHATLMTKINDDDKQIYKDVELSAENDWSYTWTGLPMDDDEKGIEKYYYYVLEENGILGLTTEESDKYIPTYALSNPNNGHTEIKITNKRNALIVQKQWLDETGEPIVDIYNEDGELKVDNTGSLPEINLNVYYEGFEGNNPKKSYVANNVKLNQENKWQAIVDINNTSGNIPADTKFYIEEVDSDGNGKKLSDSWEISYSTNNTDGQVAGTSIALVAINQKKEISKTNISVKKTWEGDSADTSKRNNISLALMRRVADDVDKDGNPIWKEVEIDMPSYEVNEDGNIWTYKYENLPVTDNAGQTYYYKVEEAEMDGYKVEYTKNDEEAVANGNIELELKNTRVLSLKLKKEWGDGKAPENTKSVTMNIYRSTNPEDVPNGVDLILHAEPKTVSISNAEGSNTVTVKANKSLKNIFVDNDNVTAVINPENDKEIIITGRTKGDATVTIFAETTTPDGKTKEESFEINVRVSNMTLAISPDTITLEEDTEPATLTVTNAIGEVKYSAEPRGYVRINADGTVTGLKDGTVIITATDAEGYNASTNLTINLSTTFELSNSPEEGNLKVGGEFQLNPTPNYGTFEYSSYPKGIVTIDENGNVKAISAGKTLITVTRKKSNGEVAGTADFSVNVSNFQPCSVTKEVPATVSLPEDFSNVTSISITVHIDDSSTAGWRYLEINLYPDINTPWVKNQLFTTTDVQTGQTYKFQIDKNWDATSGVLEFSLNCNGGDFSYTVEDIVYSYGDAAPAMLSLQNVATFYAFADHEAKPEDTDDDTILEVWQTEQETGLDVYTVKITTTNDWEKVVKDLPVYGLDASGNNVPYYYWVVEDEKDFAPFDVSYLFEDGDGNTDYCINAEKPGDGTITIRNTQIESHEISMPSTGGPGVGRSHTVGIILMCGSTASYILARRRRNRRKRA
ncbi:MAG: Cna B-type domain-containing protein [Oscillospiraceae bacterium]|nr:Cna B-type domain-containing protein [Oscillospiraceae bacterium]